MLKTDSNFLSTLIAFSVFGSTTVLVIIKIPRNVLLTMNLLEFTIEIVNDFAIVCIRAFVQSFQEKKWISYISDHQSGHLRDLEKHCNFIHIIKRQR